MFISLRALTVSPTLLQTLPFHLISQLIVSLPPPLLPHPTLTTLEWAGQFRAWPGTQLERDLPSFSPVGGMKSLPMMSQLHHRLCVHIEESPGHNLVAVLRTKISTVVEVLPGYIRLSLLSF